MDDMMIGDFESTWLDNQGHVVRREVSPHWVYYMDRTRLGEFKPAQVGKWMSFFEDVVAMAAICRDAVLEGACIECKHAHALRVESRGTGVACFYVNGDDADAHRKILSWMIARGLVQKRKDGRLYNIGFKFDKQTLSGEYGEDFQAKITLSDFVDLRTGKLI